MRGVGPLLDSPAGSQVADVYVSYRSQSTLFSSLFNLKGNDKLNTVMVDNSTPFNLIAWLNRLNVRTVDAQGVTYFYAQDVGKALEIPRIGRRISDFTDAEIVSRAVKKEKQVKTYKLYKGKLREDPRITLLTEAGVYLLALKSKSDAGKELRNGICGRGLLTQILCAKQ